MEICFFLLFVRVIFVKGCDQFSFVKLRLVKLPSYEGNMARGILVTFKDATSFSRIVIFRSYLIDQPEKNI